MARTEVEQEVTEPSMAELSSQLDSLKADMVAITETLAQLGRAKGQQVADAARSEAQALRERGEQKVADMQDRAYQLSDQTSQMVRENPATALGVAAGAGFLFGLLLSRR
ncbi:MULTISPECIES: DUF883 family protein [Haematobacter]|uniref:DUF883 domain-containing protein n=1 Tax=Haematobacter genomosp. 1 TaxID=366618 RepID=A0A212AH61_9RHOB|nr:MULTISPECIES: DUF883 family protein [Haematobacter]OWJ80755.1 hypothetical protein CDV49_00810 [Haematobacter genomosp. 1]